MKLLRLFESFERKQFYELDCEDIENEMMEYIDDRDIEIINSYEGMPDRTIYTYYKLDLSEKKVLSKPVFVDQSLILRINYFALKNRVRGNLDLDGYITSMVSHMLRRFLKYYDVSIYLGMR